jgi:hypothetical protein
VAGAGVEGAGVAGAAGLGVGVCAAAGNVTAAATRTTEERRRFIGGGPAGFRREIRIGGDVRAVNGRDEDRSIASCDANAPKGWRAAI